MFVAEALAGLVPPLQAARIDVKRLKLIKQLYPDRMVASESSASLVAAPAAPAVPRPSAPTPGPNNQRNRAWRHQKRVNKRAAVAVQRPAAAPQAADSVKKL
jgi:hypothetical protein